MEDETFSDIIQKVKRSRRYRNDSSRSELKQSNSDTNFIMNREKEKRQIAKKILRTNCKNHYTNIICKHKHSSNCKNCQSFHKILKKDKTALSLYIENNLKYLKLFGNQRYNQNSPSLFVEDYKRKISEKKMGLVPIPAKRNKTKLVNNYYKLYNLQRSIVMVRRYQYARKNYSPAPTSSKAYDITLIQRWWKKISKIITIQKFFRGYYIRKQVDSILNLYKFMNNFEYILIKLKLKYSFYKIFRSTIISRRRKPIKGYYYIKKRYFINIKNLKKIVMIQNNFRILNAKNKYRRLLREHKFTVLNKSGFISKINYKINNTFGKIIMIQFNIRKYLKNKYFIERKIIHKDIGIFYIDKNYINNYSKKVIDFYNLMRHGLQILAIKKIKSKYKKIEDYNEDDINKVLFIQKNYLNHYYNRKIHNNINIKKIKKRCNIDKLRLKDNINEIKLIQKIYRKYNINKNKFNKNIIKNKPITSSSNDLYIQKNPNYNKNNKINNKNYNYNIKIKNNKLFNYNENEKNNDKLINNICYISKENKINVINKVILLQRKIYSFLFIKNIKFKKNIKSINKKNYNLFYIITKKYTNENYCIDKIKKIQNLYKKEYIYMKNNIIEYINTKESNKSETKNTDSDENIDNNNNLKIKNKNKNKNKLPPMGNINNINNYKIHKNKIRNDSLNKDPKDKYITKYNKNYYPNNIIIKKNNHSLSQIKNNKIENLFKKSKNNNKDNNNNLPLRELIKKNKTPIKELKGNYISKKRVEKYENENYLIFNLNIFHKNIIIPIYITKSRYYNNEAKIILIQKFWRKIYNLNIIQKPKINILDETDINKKNKDKNIIYSFTPKKRNRNRLPYVKENTNSDYYNNSNKQNILPSRYDNDESYDNKNSNNKNISNNVNLNFITIKNDKYFKNNYKSNENMTQNSNYNYMSKIRKINIIKYVLTLQKTFKDFMKNKNFLPKICFTSLLISKIRINGVAYDKYIKTINESKIIIKIPKKYIERTNMKILEKNKNKKNENNFPQLNNIININGNNSEKKEINNDISYITKVRYTNYISLIEKIQKNWRIKIKNKVRNKKFRIKKCIIDKSRFINNIKEILIIQKAYRNRIFKKNEEENNLISRKFILFDSSKKKLKKKQNNKNKEKKNIKDKNNKLNKNGKIKDNKNIPNKISNLNINNNKIKKPSVDIQINKNNDSDSNYSNYSSNKEESLYDINKKEFSYSKINYISKVYKKVIYKKDINIKGIYFITKVFKKFNYEKLNISFISLLNLFITKNIQEYIYYLLKYNTIKNFNYPFYNKTLQRVLKFIRSVPSPKQGGEKIKKFFLKIFPDLYSQKSINILISSLNPENKELLIKTNIYNSIEPDFINYICSFSKYDKHLSNSSFIETRLKNTKLINSNIFNITKFIDDEYNNLINGKYCFKCYLDINKCICNKKKEDDEYYYDDEDGIDIDFDIDYYNKKKFGYDSTKCKEIKINRKEKVEEIYEDPITNLIKNKDDYSINKDQINNSKVNSINISGSQYGSNSSFGTNFNSKILNKIKNNVNSEYNSLNNSKSIAKIKSIYHQNSNKKKENLILIKNNESNN